MLSKGSAGSVVLAGCYVNETVCNENPFLMWQSSVASSLIYSYQACGGDSADWREHLFASKVRGKVLRVLPALDLFISG